jgi:hypothetical protein
MLVCIKIKALVMLVCIMINFFQFLTCVSKFSDVNRKAFRNPLIATPDDTQNVEQAKPSSMEMRPKPKEVKINMPLPTNEENKFFQELSNCDTLQNDITEKGKAKMAPHLKEPKQNEKCNYFFNYHIPLNNNSLIHHHHFLGGA